MKTKIMIVGAGPYGVSIANTLWEKGVPFQIAGQPFSLWYHHTLDTMAIRSDWHTSEIYTPSRTYHFGEFLRKHYTDTADEILKDRVPIDVFRNYLKQVEKELPYDVIREEVISLKQEKSQFLIQTGSGIKIEAEAVVLATGIGKHLYLPDCLRRLSEEQVVHVWDTKKLADIMDRRLLVVGAGQSAAESIAQLSPHNQVTWLSRSKPIFYSEPINLPVPVFNFVLKVSPYFYYLPEVLRQGFGKKFVISTITPDLKPAITDPAIHRIFGSVEELALSSRNGVVHSNKLDSDFDTVIAATGYRYHLENLDFIDADLVGAITTRHQIPALNFDFETSVPNLFVVGGMAEPAYGPAQRFMMGAGHAAERIGKVAEVL